jgi:hypothetical protein
MGSIPFTGENIHYIDPDTGFDYELRQSTDETELALIDFESQFERNVEKRLAIFNENEHEYRKWINGHVDVLLCGWSCGDKKIDLPPFPKENPSAKMPGELKMQILNWWNRQKNFTRDDLKK